jgi:hypothetical protein
MTDVAKHVPPSTDGSDTGPSLVPMLIGGLVLITVSMIVVMLLV